MNQANTNIELSNLLRLPVKTFTALSTKTALCIGSLIADAQKQGASALSIDIGIGMLGIDILNAQCKFVPSNELKNAITLAAEQGIDPLELQLEQALADKLTVVVNEVL